MTGLTVAVVLATIFASVVAARALAESKGRTPGYWGMAAMLAGPLVVVVIACMPAAREPSDPSPSVSP